MTELRSKQRTSMNKGVFAYVGKDGEGHLPERDRALEPDDIREPGEEGRRPAD